MKRYVAKKYKIKYGFEVQFEVEAENEKEAEEQALVRIYEADLLEAEMDIKEIKNGKNI